LAKKQGAEVIACLWFGCTFDPLNGCSTSSPASSSLDPSLAYTAAITPSVQAYCGGGGAVDAFIGLTCEHAPLGSRVTRPVRAAAEPSALDISGFSVSTAAPQSPAHIRQMRRDVFAPCRRTPHACALRS
jgi:hypothetical protein